MLHDLGTVGRQDNSREDLHLYYSHLLRLPSHLNHYSILHNHPETQTPKDPRNTIWTHDNKPTEANRQHFSNGNDSGFSFLYLLDSIYHFYLNALLSLGLGSSL